MDALYPASCTDKVLIDKQEYRAKGFSYKLLIPLERLRQAISYRIQYSYSLAYYFDVTTEFMANCIEFYKTKYDFMKEALIYDA